MDTSRYIQSCNPARFVVTCSLLIFAILFSLRTDGFIEISYWLVFLPLFIWKMLVIFGACTGAFVWCRHGEDNRSVRTPDNDCRALVIYLFIHLLIFTFELLTCDKLENHLEILWTTCFIPLLLCSMLIFASCLWSLRVQRNFLMQAFVSINGLVFLFLPLRLDGFTTWRYAIVFLPLWISLCIGVFFVLAKLTLAIVQHVSRRPLPNQQESSTIAEAILYAMMFIPFSVFSILLVDRLDHDPKEESGRLPFTVIAIPLWISLIAWLTFSFGATDANPWWFGLRKDLCEIILGQCPHASLYFNNQFKFESRSSTTGSADDRLIKTKPTAKSTTNEKTLTVLHPSMTLLEPD